jgi:hypothetical protein
MEEAKAAAAAGRGGRGANPGGSAANCPIKGNEVYRSSDKGASWTLVSGQGDEQRAFMRSMSNTYAWVFGNIRVDPTDENTIYTLALGVSVSNDGGKTFRRLGAPPPGAVAGGPPAAVHRRSGRAGGCPPAAPAGAGAQAGGRGANVGGDNHAMWIDPKNTDFMLSGNDSGFRVSTDHGQTWRRANLPTETAFSMAFDMDTPFRVYGSFQDHGSYRGVVDISKGRDNLQPTVWEGAPGGEYCEHAIDPRNPNIVYSGKLSRTDFSVAGGGRGGGGGAAVLPAPPARGLDRNATRTFSRALHKATIRCACRSSRRSSCLRTIPTPSTSARSLCSARGIAARPGRR